MTILRPPRREPRVLAIARNPRGLAWACVDPWDLRGAGLLLGPRRAEPTALRFLVRREKPTAIVAGSPAAHARCSRLARRLRIPLVPAPSKMPPPATVRALYPALRLVAPRLELRQVALLAIAAVLHSEIPSRPYAPRRHRAPVHAA